MMMAGPVAPRKPRSGRVRFVGGQRGAGRRVGTGVLAVVGVLTVLVLGRYGLLWAGATEGDVPPRSSVPLPAGSAIVAERTECGSGGCSLVLTVRPPTGSTPADVATAIGATPTTQLPGDLVDPRPITLSAEASGTFLEVRADLWSRPASP